MLMNQKNLVARRSARRASAVLETFFCVMLVLMPLSFGMVEFGYYFYVKHTLQGAAREGCRAGITPSGDNTDVTDAVVAYLKAAGLQTSSTTLDTSKFTVKIESPLGTSCNVAALSAGSTLFVTVQGSWPTLGSGLRPMALINGPGGTPKVVAGVTAMRKEG
jgi:Flp pilus assembly protein TadG